MKNQMISMVVMVGCLMAVVSATEPLPQKYLKGNPSLWKTGGKQGEEEYRLPGNLKPVSYMIRLLPIIEEGNFTTDGLISMVFDCLADTANITINSADIRFHQPLVVVEDMVTNDRYAVVAFIDEQATREMVTFELAAPLMAGHRYHMTFTFTSVLNDQLRGFYRSSYVENGVRKYLAVTQMEPTDARRAFPCFDEPNMKATFDIILGRKTSMTSASNTPIKSTIPIDGMPGYEWDIYESSPIMSSYLVAFLVSEYSSANADPSLSNVRFRILARPGIIDQTQYAGNIAPRVLEFYESFLGVDYPLAKMDSATVPDFWPGAMENWGLVTYQEGALMYNDLTSSEYQKQGVVSILAHELAHQWFGDLVTTDWWGTIWLNEGFANYMQSFAIDGVEPSFKARDQFVVNNMHSILARDSLDSSHAMDVTVTTPAEINTIFDGITYDKGACVIRMLADILGQETFQRGITRYLTKHAYANAKEEDLWQAMQEQAAADGVILEATVNEIMTTWTTKKNYPLITVEREYGTSEGAFVKQERFLTKPSEEPTDPAMFRWWVPLTHTTDFSNPRAITWLTDEQANRTLLSLGALDDEWVIFNVDQQGYYRVKYDERNYGLIADQLVANHRRISLLNRAQLLDDGFTLAFIDVISYDIALDLTLYLKYEREYVPWHAVLSELDYIDVMLYDQPEYAGWKIYMKTLVTPYYDFIGFEENDWDAHLTIYSRTEAVEWACRLKVDDCVNNAKEAYGMLMAQPNTMLSPNQRDFILRAGVENGGQSEWNFAFDRYKSGDQSFLRAMASTRKSEIIYSMLEMMLDPNSGIRQSDITSLFSYIAANPLGNSIAFNFLETRWDEIKTSLGTGYCESFFYSLSGRLNTQEDLQMYTDLQAAHPDVLANSSLANQGVQNVQNNVAWLDRNKEEIGNWLKDPSTATAEPSTLPTTETFPTTIAAASTTGTGQSTTTDPSSATSDPSDGSTETPPTTSATPEPSAGISAIQPRNYFAISLLFIILHGAWLLVLC